MRGRILPTLLAVLITFVLGATPASAAGWRVTPGGPFGGSGGRLSAPITCAGSSISGLFTVSGDRLGLINGVKYNGCSGTLAFSVTVDTPWLLVGIGYSAGVASIEIRNIRAYVSGPGCFFAVEGTAAASYDNSTGILSVLPNATTVITSVNGCLGLVSPGQRVSVLSPSYVISPRQVIDVV